MGGQGNLHMHRFSRTATLWKATCPLFPVREDLVKPPAAQVFWKNTRNPKDPQKSWKDHPPQDHPFQY